MMAMYVYGVATPPSPKKSSFLENGRPKHVVKAITMLDLEVKNCFDFFLFYIKFNMSPLSSN